jgi:hypothetical protein
VTVIAVMHMVSSESIGGWRQNKMLSAKSGTNLGRRRSIGEVATDPRDGQLGVLSRQTGDDDGSIC